MIKRVFLTIFCVLNIACVPEPNLTYPNVIYYGDSLCAVSFTPGELATSKVGIEKDCISGRKITELESLSNDYELIFLALSSNDVFQNTPLDEYSQHLNKLLASTDSTVICVLPVVFKNEDSSAYRAEMLNQCENVIDPQPDCGVGPRFIDDIHYTALDHQGMANCIEENIQAFYNDSI